jgi:enterochelin esterase-like enzyme
VIGVDCGQQAPPVDLDGLVQAGGDFQSMIRRSILPLLVLLLAACGPRPAPQASAVPTATAPPSPTATQMVASPTPLPTRPPACLTQPGRIEHGEVERPQLARPLPYRIYLPACAGKPGFERLPVVYLLHGLTYDDAQWDRLGAPAAADRMLAAGLAPPFLIVLPWERTGLDLEQAITEALIPEVEARYPAATGQQNRAIGGLSRGAGWALRIGLKHPQLFGAIGLHSPAVLSPDLFYLPAWVKAIPRDARPRLALDIGERDPLRPEALALAEQLNDLGLSVALTPNPGLHTESYWAEHVREYLEWYVEPWQVGANSGRTATPGSEDAGACPCAE